MPQVATCLLMYNDKLLILKRSDKVKTYKGLWGGVAGYIEENEDPYETAIKEIREEVGLEREDLRILVEGDPVEFTDFIEGVKYDWIIFPFVFNIKRKAKVRIDWEHSEFRWISPFEIVQYNTVPFLKEIVSNLLY